MEHVTKLCLNLRHIYFILEYIRNLNRNFASAHPKGESRGAGGEGEWRRNNNNKNVIGSLLLLSKRVKIVQNYGVKVGREKEGQAIIQAKARVKLELKKVEQKTSRHSEMM